MDIRRHVFYKPTNNRNKYICICKNKKDFEFIVSCPSLTLPVGQDKINPFYYNLSLLSFFPKGQAIIKSNR